MIPRFTMGLARKRDRMSIGDRYRVGVREMVRRGCDELTPLCEDAHDRWMGRSPHQVRDQFTMLRAQIVDGIFATDDASVWADLAGCITAALQHTLGKRLYPTQILAGWHIAAGRIAQMQTGEGKTLACFLPACLMAATGRGVHVVCPNDYLAQRDAQLLSPAFASLGLACGIVLDDQDSVAKADLYHGDVVYAPGAVLGFDYLRDRLAETQWMRLGRSHRLAQTAMGHGRPPAMMRPLHAVIVDEADHVLIDDAVSPLILSQRRQVGRQLDDLLMSARRAAMRMQSDIDYVVRQEDRQVEFTADGFHRVYADQWPVDDARLKRPWHDYVRAALLAQHVFQRDRDYVIQDQTVQIVDRSTGRIFADRSWSGGIHQAVEAKEGVPVTAETESASQTTRQAFFRRYRWIGGMTGTSDGCQREFASVYRCCVQTIPLRLASRRCVLADAIFADQDAKFQWIVDEAMHASRIGRAVLIGTLSIEQSLAISQLLDRCGVRHQVLSGIQDRGEAEIIADAGQSGAVTVATSLAGRGTDIALDATTRQRGGLHVIVCEHHRLARVDRQLIGRCARGGDPGTARFCLAADDGIAQGRNDWFGGLIRGHVRSAGNGVAGSHDHGSLVHPIDVPPGQLRQHVLDIQQNQQRNETAARLAMMRQHQVDQAWQTSRPAWQPDSELSFQG
ncbi:preprotein translocase subunit SecA [Crateriforma conspicua]|uniref:Preprotein translocase subunit SecA n=1 Tax=Crateriforma conspicua TaxID=2527996 RepID=A0A5C6FN60_9PLAN|nr:preprotein translocase subunit SecA [Crateriforma conspicua]TWU61803.1 preprotein translocase subunit SecA [Crateriforma conspicua]